MVIRTQKDYRAQWPFNKMLAKSITEKHLRQFIKKHFHIAKTPQILLLVKSMPCKQHTMHSMWSEASPEAMLIISLTIAFWASSYSSLFLVYSSFRELSLLQTREGEKFNGQVVSWGETGEVPDIHGPVCEAYTIFLNIQRAELLVVPQTLLLLAGDPQVETQDGVWFQLHCLTSFQAYSTTVVEEVIQINTSYIYIKTSYFSRAFQV